MAGKIDYAEIEKLLSEGSVLLYGFDIFTKMNYAERVAFENSEEAGRLIQLQRERRRREVEEQRSKMHDAERRLADLEAARLLLQLEKINRQIEADERRATTRNKGGDCRKETNRGRG